MRMMQKRFNTTGSCNPDRHYMVDLSAKLSKIESLIDDGRYFTINRARQFGKTTVLYSLWRRLRERYLMVPISFEGVGDAFFSSEAAFCRGFVKLVGNALRYSGSEGERERWASLLDVSAFDDLSESIGVFCGAVARPVVLMIDEVDKSSDNQMFLNFLGMLRSRYLLQQSLGECLAFHGVILAGVYDVKSLKLRLRPDEERKYNSPWNIATDFKVDLSFSPTEIASMLREYESERRTGLDVERMAGEIYKYTSGYPFLVSKLCEIVDAELERDWSEEGIQRAVKLLEADDECTLVSSLVKSVENDSEMKLFLRELLLNNVRVEFNANSPVMGRCKLHGILKSADDGAAVVHNHVFERVLYNYFIAERQMESVAVCEPRSLYVADGKLNMPLVIERFQHLMRSEYRKSDERFLERQGRLLFLCFLKPIINGRGFYYVEPQTRENSRMDIVVSYGGQEFVVELKLWRGQKYEVEGKVQLAEYLSARGLDEGYLVTFSFLKDKVVQDEPEWIEHQGKRIYEAVI